MSRRACPPARTVGYRADDADLWLLWAVSQYVLATRDFAFLGQREPYLGTTRSGTVLQHLELAFRHQLGAVGFGPHGEFRMLGDSSFLDF